MTHFIRIPLLNQTSSAQIQDTLWRVSNDPAAASVPPIAFQRVQQLKLSVAGLSLPTQETRDRAISLLQELGNQDWQKLFYKAQEIRPNTRKPSSASPRRLSDEDVGKNGSQPLMVSAILEVMCCQWMYAMYASRAIFLEQIICNVLQTVIVTQNVYPKSY